MVSREGGEMLSNVPDDWGMYYMSCGRCNGTFHASEGGCDCMSIEAERWLADLKLQRGDVLPEEDYPDSELFDYMIEADYIKRDDDDRVIIA